MLLGPANYLVAGQFALSDRTVSRRHLTVDVGEVGPKDCVRNPKYIVTLNSHSFKGKYSNSLAHHTGGSKYQAWHED